MRSHDFASFEHCLNHEPRSITNLLVDPPDVLADQPQTEDQHADQEKRKKLVWEIDRKLQEDAARPIIFHDRAATCWQPEVKGQTMMVNSIYNGWRMEDVWLDR